MGNHFRKNRTPRYPVFHVPHAGGAFPAGLAEAVCIPEETFHRYHEQMRDTDIFMAVPEAYRDRERCRIFRVSRLLCDVERFIGPEEVMERYGMGFCYEKAYDGTVIKRVTEAQRKKTLAYYRAHHAEMDRICARHPRMLLFDMHSYWDEIVPRDFLREGMQTPDLCIGADGRYTPPALTEIVRKRYVEAGFTTAVNVPYAGCFVPDCVMNGSAACDLAAIMLEVHRRVYCDAEGRSIPERLALLRKINSRIVADCAALD